MQPRALQLPENKHFFLFGARGTGKSTLLAEQFPENEHIAWFNLLQASMLDRLSTAPDELSALIRAHPEWTHVVIDEVQKVPPLLDVVHDLIEQSQRRVLSGAATQTGPYFILSGSSARKIRRGAANLLAGRARVLYLFPFTCLEWPEETTLETLLLYGTLPHLSQLAETEKKDYLISYAHTYLQEEILAEQAIRKLAPFRRFLEVAAQCNGKILNLHRIANDVGSSDNTVENYFSILDDTLLGFFLEPFHHSFRKRFMHKPKFYFFDLGVARALARQLTLPLQSGTSFYGEVFEQFIVIEIRKLLAYFQPEYRMSFLQTKDGFEVDLVIERPGKPLLLVEIKSATQVSPSHFHRQIAASKELKAELICLCNEPKKKQYDELSVFPWKEGLLYCIQ